MLDCHYVRIGHSPFFIFSLSRLYFDHIRVCFQNVKGLVFLPHLVLNLLQLLQTKELFVVLGRHLLQLQLDIFGRLIFAE